MILVLHNTSVNISRQSSVNSVMGIGYDAEAYQNMRFLQDLLIILQSKINSEINSFKMFRK
jgi:hypothetical protein